VSHGQCNGSPRPYSRFSRPERFVTCCYISICFKNIFPHIKAIFRFLSPYEYSRPSSLNKFRFIDARIMNRKGNFYDPLDEGPIYIYCHPVPHTFPSSGSINLSSENIPSMIAICSRKWCGCIDACLLMTQFSSPLRMITSASLPGGSVQPTERLNDLPQRGSANPCLSSM
jgi:hypothetical protein